MALELAHGNDTREGGKNRGRSRWGGGLVRKLLTTCLKQRNPTPLKPCTVSPRHRPGSVCRLRQQLAVTAMETNSQLLCSRNNMLAQERGNHISPESIPPSNSNNATEHVHVRCFVRMANSCYSSLIGLQARLPTRSNPGFHPQAPLTHSQTPFPSYIPSYIPRLRLPSQAFSYMYSDSLPKHSHTCTQTPFPSILIHVLRLPSQAFSYMYSDSLPKHSHTWTDSYMYMYMHVSNTPEIGRFYLRGCRWRSTPSQTQSPIF